MVAEQRVSDHGARVAAGLLKISLEEYRRHEAADEHHCAECGAWKPRDAFRVNHRRPRGVRQYCQPCDSRLAAEGYQRGQMRRRAADQQQRFYGISHAGPAFSRGRRTHPTPEGAVAVSRADSAISESGASCAQPATAPSGHIYRAVDLLTPAMLDEAGATMLAWMVPVGVVTRDGARRGEAAG